MRKYFREVVTSVGIMRVNLGVGSVTNKRKLIFVFTFLFVAYVSFSILRYFLSFNKSFRTLDVEIEFSFVVKNFIFNFSVLVLSLRSFNFFTLLKFRLKNTRLDQINFNR